MSLDGVTASWHGIFPYLVSPLDRAGRVHADVLGRLVEHLIACGVHGLSPLGSTGEFPYLTPAQRKETVRVVVEAARARVPVVPGVAAYGTADAIQQVRELLEVGADGVVLILQAFFPLPRDAVIDFFTSVASAAACPIVLYSNPRLLGVDLAPEEVISLSALPNIRYYKDASGQTGRLLTVLNRAGRRIGVFSASAHIPLVVFRLGGVGWMAGPACLIPRRCVELYALAAARRWEEAEALQRRLWPVNEVFQKHGLAACVKVGLQAQGYDVGDPIAPQRPLGAEAREEIMRVLRSLDET